MCSCPTPTMVQREFRMRTRQSQVRPPVRLFIPRGGCLGELCHVHSTCWLECVCSHADAARRVLPGGPARGCHSIRAYRVCDECRSCSDSYEGCCITGGSSCRGYAAQLS